jgi:hypothetical protein
MKGMSAFWDNVRFLPWQPKAKAQRLKTHGAFFLVICGIVVGHNR